MRRRRITLARGVFHRLESNSADPWGHIVRLLPFLDQSLVFNSLDLTRPVTDPVNVQVTALPLRILLCPSDADRLDFSEDPLALPGWWRNNYRGNAGNDTGEIAPDGTENNNGIFVTGRRVSIDYISDGVGNTALFCEALLGDGSDDVVSKPGDWFVISPPSHNRQDLYSALQAIQPVAEAGSQVSLAGRTFTSGDYLDTRYNHIMPPNGPSGVVPNGADLVSSINNGAQATTASSRHPGGVNLALADGSLRFVKDSIDVQVWWALGSINGGEKIYEEY